MSQNSRLEELLREISELKSENASLKKICKINKIDPLVERSRSGRGAHL